MADRVPLRVVTPDATAEEVAAITAAIATAVRQSRVTVAPGATAADGSQWVHAARITARRSSYARGSWRLSGRIGRRSRA